MNLVLGPGARNRGALCDQIPDTMPGVGYVTVDGIAEPIRDRFSHITDDTITQLTLEPGMGRVLVVGAAVGEAAS